MDTQTIAYAIRDNLYLNISDRCTLRCRFCPKHNGTRHVHEHDLALHHRPATAEIIQAIGDPGRYREVVFCGYGEPTLRLKVLLEVAGFIKAHGGTVRINTDGLANRVHKRNVLPEMKGRIDALSISLNASDATVYARHCRPALTDSYRAMRAFLTAAPRYISRVTATAVDGLEGVDISACEKMAIRAGAVFRRRHLGIVG